MKKTQVVRCPNCNVKLQVRSSKDRGKCPKCATAFRFPTKALPVAQPIVKTVDAQIVSKPIEQPVSFAAFVSRYFRATRGSMILWLLVVILVCLFASFLKPMLGMTSVVAACVLCCLFSAVTAVFFLIGRTSEFFFQKSKTLPARPKSLMAALAFGSGLTTLGLIALTSVEYFAPEKGLLASNVEPVEKFQDAVHDTFTKNPPSDGKASVEREGFAVLGSRGESNEQSTANHSDRDRKEGSAEVSASDFLPNQNQMASGDATHEFSRNEQSQQTDGFSSGFGNTASYQQGDATTQTRDKPPKAKSNHGSTKNEELVSIEVSLGLDGRKTSDLLMTDSACEPGGSFYEPLRVPEEAILWGGQNVAPEPGGRY